MARSSINAGGLIFLALALLTLPLRWILAAVVAGIVHELCHWVAVMLCGGKIRLVRLSGIGAVMEAERIGGWRAVICSLAGPVGGLLLIFVARWFPAVAVCGVFQSLYNLLPLYPLDGGRALREFLGLFLSQERVELWATWIKRVCLGAIFLAAGYAAVWLKLGLMPLLLAMAVVVKTKSAKIPCIAAAERVQ